MTNTCEACRRAPVEVVMAGDEDDQPYRLCLVCQRRLKHFALRPLEWFNLAALHGPNTHHLHDDFYWENGIAEQPDEEVEEPEEYPAPTRLQAEGDLERLIDYALTRYLLESEVVAALSRHPKEAILSALRRRVEPTCNVAIEAAAYEICAQVVGTVAGDWIRNRWDNFRPDLLLPLSEAVAHCLTFDEGFAKVTTKLESLSVKELQTACFALAHFRSPRTFEWIEEHQEVARTYTCTLLAALSHLSWSRIATWLDCGHPLSHLALAAMHMCLQDDLNPITKRYKPVLEQPASIEEMNAALEAYLEKDAFPGVRRSVRGIQAKWNTKRPQPDT